MKAFRIDFAEKVSGKKWSSYTVGDSEEQAKGEANSNFDRFNVILGVKDISNTKKGKELILHNA